MENVMTAFNLPNTLTVARIVLIPVFVTAIIYRRYDYALALFVVAALTDTLDGLVARVKSQKTALGTFLDPLADKFLLVTSFVLFSLYELIPTWLTVTIISRDIIVVTGWTLLYILTHVSKVRPTITGKIAIALQMTLICYVLLHMNFAALPDIRDYLVWAAAFFTVVSGLHYVYRGLTEGNA